MWDGGPVKVEGTVSEGDDIAGFKVVDFPGHAPGLIGLWREDDRLALVSDTFYTLNPQTGHKGAPRVPHPAFNYDTDQARASIRKLAEMEPASAWPGTRTRSPATCARSWSRRSPRIGRPWRCPGWESNPHVREDSGF